MTVRGAVSIGRRLMDPLAELVKIDPKSIGVGQYQHDVDQGGLKEALDRVVESCVNKVGVNVNTASKYLLTYISGLGPALAENVVAYIQENGALKSREELKKVKRMGAKAFEQSAGFLRIEGAGNPLDNSAVHPESYYIVEKMARDLGVGVHELIGNETLCGRIEPQRYVDEKTGLLTLKDIVAELRKPGRDPRTNGESIQFCRRHFKNRRSAGGYGNSGNRYQYYRFRSFCRCRSETGRFGTYFRNCRSLCNRSCSRTGTESTSDGKGCTSGTRA